MMSKEEKAKMLLDVYECEKSRLQKEYKAKTDKADLAATKDNTIDPDKLAEETIKINTWYENEVARIENRFLKAIMHMEERC